MPVNRTLIAPIAAFSAVAILLFSALIGMGQIALGSSGQSTVRGAAAGFVSDSAPGVCRQASVPLGAAGNFRILAGTTVTNTGATTVKGNLGVSPGSAVTGFPPGTVTGKKHIADTAAARAQKDLVTAYTNAMGRSNCPVSVAGNIGGKTLGPGLYRSTSSLAISSGDLTLSAHGHSGAVFIFQIVTKFTTTSGRDVILAGGAQASNIFWAVGSSASLGTTSVVYGNILAHKSISLATGATLHGRALAHIGAVTLAGNKLSATPPPSGSAPQPAAAAATSTRLLP